MRNAEVCRVLLVEDDAGDASLVRHMLRGSAYPRFEVALAGSLGEAERQLGEAPPDVLLLDLSLPDSSGIETVRSCRRAADGLPLIVLTGHDDTDFALQSLDAGAQDYLVKGNFDADGLVRAIRYALIRARLEARNQLLLASLEAVGNGVMITDLEARIEWVNGAFVAISGFSRDELIGHKPSEMLKSGVHDAGFYQSMWETILAGRIWHGEVVNRRKDGSLQDEEITISPVKDANGVIRNFVGVKQDISERKQTEERIRHMAQHDALTDLPNRALFSDRLQQALSVARRGKLRLAVMFVDLDKFKPVNDGFGHDIGDLLLKEVARRMQACVRESDTVARIGGDEFVVLLHNVDAAQDALNVAEKIRAALNRPFEIAGNKLSISSSTGVALYPEHGKVEIELAKNADMAMYAAKEAGRDRVVLYQPERMSCSAERDAAHAGDGKARFDSLP